MKITGYHHGSRGPTVHRRTLGENEMSDREKQLQEGVEELIRDLTRIGAISRHDLPIRGRSIVVDRLRRLLFPTQP